MRFTTTHKIPLKKFKKIAKYEKIEGKAEKVERLMKKGYRKGYRVPKRPAGRKKSRSSSRKSGR